MPIATPVRKSGRQRVPNKKYTVDAFEGLDILGSDSEHDIEILRISEKRAAEDDREGQDDFSGDDSVVEPLVEDDDPLSVHGDTEASGIATPDEDDEEALDSDTAEPAGPVRPGRKSHPLPLDEVGHSRGMNESSLKYVRASDALFVEQIVGSNLEEQASFQRTRDKWAGNISLPTKRVDSHGQGGMGYPLNYSTEQRNMEATIGWDWYYDEGGRALFERKQVTEALSLDDGVKHIPNPSKTTKCILLGPYGKQRVFLLSLMQSLSLDEAWKLARMTAPSDPDGTGKIPGKRQDGWMLNVGTGVRCLEWAPNHPKETQYLAISTLPPKKPQTGQAQPTAPAYTPSLPYPSSIQIWAFGLVEASGKTSHLPPELEMMLCTEWGHAKQLKWCPMPRDTRTDEPKLRIHLGLLAGVWSDGYTRVLDVYLDKSLDGSARYVKYKAAVFEARPPSTVCTCVTWLSPTDIAVGCANGYVAVWDICPKTSTFRSRSLPDIMDVDESTPPRPYMYLPIHQSYILAMSNAYPPHPYMLCTSSLSGHVRLTDLRSPAADFIFGAHIRFGPSSLSYCAHLSCFLTTHEDGQFVRALPLRRFWANVGLARSESELFSISAAPLHPTILCGHANGTLLAFNPLKRYLGGKLRTGQPQHKVWQHEWTQTKQTTQEEQGEREGISRITEGYKVDDAWLHQDSARPVKVAKGKHRIDELAPTSTVYEEASGIKEISWNPNLVWGGWAATGMGSGLVRVEDLSI